MNFLSHHAVARAVAPDQDALFYAGNILPDLIGMSTEGRLRAHHVATATGPLADGVRLHLACDKAFHGDPEFKQLCATATAHFHAASFTQPPQRVFFLAHVAVELALDGYVIQSDARLAHDLDQQVLETAEILGAQASVWFGKDRLPGLEAVVAGFIARPFTPEYGTASGLARRLAGVARRAGLAPFLGEDLATLAQVMERTMASVAFEAAELLHRTGQIWYNSPRNQEINRHADYD